MERLFGKGRVAEKRWNEQVEDAIQGLIRVQNNEQLSVEKQEEPKLTKDELGWNNDDNRPLGKRPAIDEDSDCTVYGKSS